MKNRLKHWRSAAVVGIALLLVAGLSGIKPRGAQAKPLGYTFTRIAFFGKLAPGGGKFTLDFEPYGINNSSEVAFAADLTTGGEGVFVGHQGQISQLARSGQPAPGGGMFGLGVWGHTALNDGGDVAFAFILDPLTLPLGLNSGVYRYSHANRTLSAVVVPGATPAPGGGRFQGAFIHASINNQGNVAFAGIVPTDHGIVVPGQEPLGLGMGVFVADKKGKLASVVSPGDPAPGGVTFFDFAENPWINDAGDVAFGAHVAGEECIDFGVDQATRIFCAESVYLKKARGEIISIAHQGQMVPGVGTFHHAFGPVVNNRGQVVFVGDLLSPPRPPDEAFGVFLWSDGRIIPVALPGDGLPGGGTLTSVNNFIATYALNNRGDVTFTARLDTEDADNIADATGLYLWSQGELHLVARTGTVIPDVGTVVQLLPPDVASDPDIVADPSGFSSLEASNDHGQVLFTATVDDGSGNLQGVLLVATPQGN